MQTSVAVLFEVGIRTKRQDLRAFDSSDKIKAHGTATTPAKRKATVRHEGGRVHQAVGAVFNPVNPAGGDAIAWFIASSIQLPCSRPTPPRKTSSSY